MPALDFIDKSAETTVDISANVVTNTAAVEMSRAGFALGEGVTVYVTEASAANMNTTNSRSLSAALEVSVDNGTTYFKVAERSLSISAAGVPLQRVWMPVMLDFVPERYTPANIQWRGSVFISEVLASADDFNVQFWLGNGPIGHPSWIPGPVNGVSA